MSGEEQRKPTLREILPRIKLLFFMVMSFPVIGMVAVLVILAMKPPQNFEIIAGVILFLILFYTASNFYIMRKIDEVSAKKD